METQDVFYRKSWEKTLTHLVYRFVFVVPELVWGRGLVDSFVDEGDGEDGRGVVEVVAQGRVEVVSVKRLRSAYLVRLGKCEKTNELQPWGHAG